MWFVCVAAHDLEEQEMEIRRMRATSMTSSLRSRSNGSFLDNQDYGLVEEEVLVNM